jgi:hypothetical protein
MIHVAGFSGTVATITAADLKRRMLGRSNAGTLGR